MYNLIEYSDNYTDSSGSLYQFKRDEQNMTNAGSPDNLLQIVHRLLNTKQIF